MKCFLTGGRGFVGRHLAALLRSRGHSVTGIAGRRASVGLPGCDLNHSRKLSALLAQAAPQRVFHLAAFSNPQDSFAQPLDCYRTNLQGTLNILEAVRRHCPGARVVVVSTCQVYRAGASQPLAEEAPLEPLSPYASSKRLVEQAAQDYSRLFGLDVVITRSFNHSGPGQSPRYVLSDFCRQVVLREIQGGQAAPLEVGALTPVRDFLDVRDVVRAYAALADQGHAGEIYNVCSARPTSIRDLLRLCLSQAAVPLSYQSRSQRLRSGEADRIVGDHSKLLRDTAWRPAIPLSRTVVDTLDDWRSRLAGGGLGGS